MSVDYEPCPWGGRFSKDRLERSRTRGVSPSSTTRQAHPNHPANAPGFVSSPPIPWTGQELSVRMAAAQGRGGMSHPKIMSPVVIDMYLSTSTLVVRGFW